MGLQGRPWNDCKGDEKKALRKRFDTLYLDGDLDWDADVDSADITAVAGAFTAAKTAGKWTNGTPGATLRYQASNGQVWLKADESTGANRQRQGHCPAHRQGEECQHDHVFDHDQNAPGIPEEIIGRIFEPFFTTKEEGKGRERKGMRTLSALIVSVVFLAAVFPGPCETPGTKGGDGGKPGNGNGNARITNKQLNYVVNLGRSLGLNSKDLDQETVKTYGVKMSFLTTKQASAFIDTLKSRSA